MKRKYKVYSVLRNLAFVALGVDRDAEKLYYHYSTN